MKSTQNQIIDFMREKDIATVHELSKELKLSPQMVHRHLKALLAQGVITKVGLPPKTQYRCQGQEKSILSKELTEQLRVCAEILSCHPAVKLVTLFGSQARGDTHENSDIDLLIWISSEDASFNRQDIWSYFDRHARNLPWKDKVSLVVRKLKNPIMIQTLLLDLPEEHRSIYDSGNLFENLRIAIIKWREKWGAKRLPSFGGKHGWIYSTRTQNIDEIDFRLEIKNVP